jgi:hypothetical protein
MKPLLALPYDWGLNDRARSSMAETVPHQPQQGS